MQPTALIAEAPRPGWLRGPGFDALFIGGVFLLALVLGLVAGSSEAAFINVLLLDVWLIAYPHVASTYTRIAFDSASARRYWYLLTLAFPLVLGATALTTYLWGAVFLNSLYFYWQTFHYSRQSYGIARAYGRAAGKDGPATDALTTLVIAAFPVWGLLHRASQQQPFFYSAPLYSPAVPRAAAAVVGAGTLALLLVWLVRRLRAPHATRVAQLGQTLFVLSHVAMTFISYVAIAEVTAGWLFINVWHNAQYIAFVWVTNAREFRAGVQPRKRLISWLSQPKNVLVYAATCLGLSTLTYLLLGMVTARLEWNTLPTVMVVFLAFNFHHYVVDAVIWRSPVPPPNRTLR